MIATEGHPGRTGDALVALFDAHGDAVYRLGLRLCDDPDSAEDLVQETFLRAHRNWDHFEGRSDPMTWLYTIASRACHRMQRRRAGEPRRIESLSKLLLSESGWRSDVPAGDESPLDYTIRREESDRMRAAISALPAAFRLPLVLKELQDLTIREVAEILGLREATVKTRLHRARLTLGRELASGARKTAEDEAAHSRRECVDLITAKLEAMAHGVSFPIKDEQVCSACSSSLSALDRTRDVCSGISTHPLPAELRARVLETLREFEGST